MRVSPLLIRGSVWYSPLTDHSNESIAAIGDTVTDPINESIANGDTLIRWVGQAGRETDLVNESIAIG